MTDEIAGERWEKCRMFGSKPGEVLWAILAGPGQRVVGSALLEVDADAIVAAHDAAPSAAQAVGGEG